MSAIALFMSSFLSPSGTLSFINETEVAIDGEGPSCQFLTDVFKQIEVLCVKVGNDTVKLFETTHSGVVVVTDEVLEYYITRAALKSSSADQEMMKTAAVKQAKDYVRAIGRIILHAMVNGYILPIMSIPPFFMTGENSLDHIISQSNYCTNDSFSYLLGICFIFQVIFHGYDETYRRDDILNHLGMKSTSNKFMDDDGNELTPEKFFTTYIPDKFIHSRKILLGSLQNGLAVGVNPLNTKGLERGCGMASEFFSKIPLEAIQKMYFSKLSFSVEDLISVLVPEYDGEYPSLRSIPVNLFRPSFFRLLIRMIILKPGKYATI